MSSQTTGFRSTEAQLLPLPWNLGPQSFLACFELKAKALGSTTFLENKIMRIDLSLPKQRQR